MPYNARVSDVAEFFDVKEDTVYKWANSHYIPHLRIGRGGRKLLRFDLAELDVWKNDKLQEGRNERIPEIELA